MIGWIVRGSIVRGWTVRDWIVAESYVFGLSVRLCVRQRVRWRHSRPTSSFTSVIINVEYLSRTICAVVNFICFYVVLFFISSLWQATRLDSGHSSIHWNWRIIHACKLQNVCAMHTGWAKKKQKICNKVVGATSSEGFYGCSVSVYLILCSKSYMHTYLFSSGPHTSFRLP